MKAVYRIYEQFLTFFQKSEVIRSKKRDFFDYSSGEKIKIMRAAGKEAQRKQMRLLKAYENRFGQT